MSEKVVLARFGIEVKVPAEHSDGENALDLDKIEDEVREHLATIAARIRVKVPWAEVTEDRR